MYSAQGYNSKEDLVTRYAPLVKRIAYHLIGRLPASVLVDDLIQAGMLGLLDAANQYDQSQGASFETYATIRIRGSMLDELRRNDWAPKSVHRKARELADAIHTIEMTTGRAARDDEIAEAMGISLDDYYKILQDSSASRMVSLDDSGDDNFTSGFSIADDSDVPAENVAEDQFRGELARAISQLPERERMVMVLYYDRELNLKEIGAILKVSESRVSQIMSQAHGRLRSRLRDFT